jgi:hypothetical protein
MTDVDIVPIIGLGAALTIALIVCMYKISGKLSKIEDNTSIISEIRNELTKLTVGIDMALRYGVQSTPKGTVTLTLKNLGKVQVSAEPTVDKTNYYIEVETPVLKVYLIARKSKETELVAKENELFGKEPDFDVFPGFRRMVLRVPSIDPAVCSQYVSFFLKWLDTRYWDALKELDEYERITV